MLLSKEIYYDFNDYGSDYNPDDYDYAEYGDWTNIQCSRPLAVGCMKKKIQAITGNIARF